METLFYLAKSSLVILLFYGVYIIFLQKETHFLLTRYFLLSGLITAVSLPLVYIPIMTTVVVESNFQPTHSIVATAVNNQDKVVSWDVSSVVLKLYLVGVFAMLIRFLLQLFSVFKLIVGQKTKRQGKYKIVEIQKNILPFSFFNFIVYNPKNHSSQHLEVIINHEKQHVNQNHSIDTLFMALFKAVFWFNPLVWLYEKEVQKNLEFLADRQAVLHTSVSRYQEVLVQSVLKNIQPVTLTASFYQSLIKKRIVMLNTINSRPVSKFKVLFILPFLVIFLFSFNIKEKTVYLGILQSQKEYVITENASNKELKEIENAINKESKLKIIFDDVTRKNNKIVKLSLSTSANGIKFDRRLTKEKNKNGVFVPFSIKLIENKDGLLFQEKETLATIYADSLEIKKENITVSSERIRKTTTKQQITSTILGENPLYLINGKEYRKKELLEKTQITLDGEWIVLTKEEGIRKYGKKGEDGVYELVGLAKLENKPKNSNE